MGIKLFVKALEELPVQLPLECLLRPFRNVPQADDDRGWRFLNKLLTKVVEDRTLPGPFLAIKGNRLPA